MVLNIENQQLKKQLVMRSLIIHPAATSSTPSSLSLTIAEAQNGSSENEEVCEILFYLYKNFRIHEL